MQLNSSFGLVSLLFCCVCVQFYELLTPGTSTTTRTQNSKMVPHLLFPLPLPILTPGNQPWSGPSLTVPLFVNAIHHTEMYPCSRYLQIYYNFPAHGFIILAPRPGGQADGQEGASLPAQHHHWHFSAELKEDTMPETLLTGKHAQFFPTH